MSPHRTLSAALLTTALVGCSTEPSSTSAPDVPLGPARDLVVVAQANVHGDIEPCG
jgi:hypothetical protein